MSENDGDIFGDLVQDLEAELNTKLLEKRGAHAMAAARIVGAVYIEATASGVPAGLATDMATDTWMALMGFEMPTVVTVSAAAVDDDDDEEL